MTATREGAAETLIVHPPSCAPANEPPVVASLHRRRVSDISPRGDPWLLPRLRRRAAGDERFEDVRFGGLREMEIKPRFQRSSLIFFLSPSRERNYQHLRPESGADQAPGFVSVHARHP